jgi:hypothetical protein
MTTTTTNPYPHVPLPARAVHTDPWRDDGDGLGAFRFFFQGSVWNLELPDDRHEVVGRSPVSNTSTAAPSVGYLSMLRVRSPATRPANWPPS